MMYPPDMATSRDQANKTRQYLTYILTPPAVAVLSVLLLGNNLVGNGAVLSVFFIVFIFSAIATLATIFFPNIVAYIDSKREADVVVKLEKD